MAIRVGVSSGECGSDHIAEFDRVMRLWSGHEDSRRTEREYVVASIKLVVNMTTRFAKFVLPLLLRRQVVDMTHHVIAEAKCCRQLEHQALAGHFERTLRLY